MLGFVSDGKPTSCHLQADLVQSFSMLITRLPPPPTPSYTHTTPSFTPFTTPLAHPRPLSPYPLPSHSYIMFLSSFYTCSLAPFFSCVSSLLFAFKSYTLILLFLFLIKTLLIPLFFSFICSFLIS
jgi:hypothetical protein